MKLYLLLGINKKSIEPTYIGIFAGLSLAKNIGAQMNSDNNCPYDGVEVYEQEQAPTKDSKMKRVWWFNFE